MEQSVMTFQASCFWGHKFEIPILSEFSYGEFFYVDTTGRSYKYFAAINNPIWNFISYLLPNNKLRNNKELEVIQYLIGRIADKEIPNDFYQNEKRICPVCQSKWVSYNEDKRTGVRNFEHLTFNRFENQNEDSKTEEIKQLVKASKFVKD